MPEELKKKFIKDLFDIHWWPYDMAYDWLSEIFGDIQKAVENITEWYWDKEWYWFSEEEKADLVYEVKQLVYKELKNLIG